MKKHFLVLAVLLLSACGGGGGGGSSSASSHTALCNDGTYSDSKSCSGTCSSHGGVKEWYVLQCGDSVSQLSLSTDGNSKGSNRWSNRCQALKCESRLFINFANFLSLSNSLFNLPDA